MLAYCYNFCCSFVWGDYDPHYYVFTKLLTSDGFFKLSNYLTVNSFAAILIFGHIWSLLPDISKFTSLFSADSPPLSDLCYCWLDFGSYTKQVIRRWQQALKYIACCFKSCLLIMKAILSWWPTSFIFGGCFCGYQPFCCSLYKTKTE